MLNFTKRTEDRLRNAAILMVSLPIVTAAACFAHGHGALGISGLLVLLTSAFAAGAIGASNLFSLIRSGRDRRSRPRLPLASVRKVRIPSN